MIKYYPNKLTLSQKQYKLAFYEKDMYIVVKQI